MDMHTLQSTERELLEMAAKAYGDPHVQPGQPHFTRWIGRNEDMGCDVMVRWDPLHDDGDALRLAARLRLRIDPGKHMGDGCSVNPQDRPGIPGCTCFRDNKDMAEQMRYAITRVAAEIGKAMP